MINPEQAREIVAAAVKRGLIKAAPPAKAQARAPIGVKKSKMPKPAKMATGKGMSAAESTEIIPRAKKVDLKQYRYS
jgi:hypothetical protein